MKYNEMQCNAMHYNTIQYNTIIKKSKKIDFIVFTLS